MVKFESEMKVRSHCPAGTLELSARLITSVNPQ